jgi:hypothetical protein
MVGRLGAAMARSGNIGARILAGVGRAGLRTGAAVRTVGRAAATRPGKFAMGAGAVGAFSMYGRDVNKRGGYNPPSGSSGLRPKSSGGSTL